MKVTPIDRFLFSLYQVQQCQPSQFSESCHAHEDTSLLLSVRNTPEGPGLLHCFGGFSAHEITTALALSMFDLFTPQQEIKRVLGVA